VTDTISLVRTEQDLLLLPLVLSVLLLLPLLQGRVLTSCLVRLLTPSRECVRSRACSPTCTA
jgi:hypothetical protein